MGVITATAPTGKDIRTNANLATRVGDDAVFQQTFI